MISHPPKKTTARKDIPSEPSNTFLRNVNRVEPRLHGLPAEPKRWTRLWGHDHPSEGCAPPIPRVTPQTRRGLIVQSPSGLVRRTRCRGSWYLAALECPGRGSQYGSSDGDNPAHCDPCNKGSVRLGSPPRSVLWGVNTTTSARGAGCCREKVGIPRVSENHRFIKRPSSFREANKKAADEANVRARRKVQDIKERLEAQGLSTSEADFAIMPVQRLGLTTVGEVRAHLRHAWPGIF